MVPPNFLKKENVCYKLYVSTSNFGTIYGLLKVQTKDIPPRPILSVCGTPQYGIAKYLIPILFPISTNEYTAKDSFSFAREMSSFVAKIKVMDSFDVKSLFTSIPLKETWEIIVYELFENSTENISISDSGEKSVSCSLLRDGN